MGRPGVFAACVVIMSLQPVLLNLSASQPEQPGLPPDVFMLAAEAMKVLLCVLALACRRALGLEAAVWCGVGHSAAFVVPALLYLAMNVLKVAAARAIAPPLFQLLSSTKILTTAVSSRLLLGRVLTVPQWAALVLLTVGVALGQRRDDGGAAAAGAAASGGSPSRPAAEEAVSLVPAAIMLLNSCISALAAVYTEKVLKARQSVSLSIFATNLHMASHTLVVNLARACVSGAPVLAFPSSLGWRTWAALGNEALNGILVSLLMRSADSIVKNYAFAASIFATALLAVPVMDHRPQWPFFVGSLLVLCSMVLYTHQGWTQGTKKAA
mmetsp:Transcript_36773/g.114457  ORF Transcript_36773/g.114457 Transcript_36773/m.114457 type:complete len:326 (-) Transcript_36773:35-1012(-)